MGTPEFALPTLERLSKRYPVVGVVTQPDRPAGRGRHVSAPPVKELALAEGIPVFQPERLRRMEAVERIRGWSPDVIVVAAYGQILPPSVLEIPPHGSLNVHASLLPRWRGAAPVQAALMAGDTVTGVTIMLMDEGMDTGPILAQEQTPIGPKETAGMLEARLAEMGGRLLMQVLPDYLAGRLEPQPQPEEGVEVIYRIPKKAARIDWTRSAQALHDHVRAFAPAPGAYTQWKGQRLKVFETRVLPPDAETAEGAPGQVFLWDDVPAVLTGEGALALLQVQMAGKRPMKGAAFVRGRRHFVGAQLGSPQPGE